MGARERERERRRVNSLVDEVHGLRFQLVGAVQVGQDEDLGGIFHGQTGTQRVFTHDLQPLQGVLNEREHTRSGRQPVFKTSPSRAESNEDHRVQKSVSHWVFLAAGDQCEVIKPSNWFSGFCAP